MQNQEDMANFFLVIMPIWEKKDSIPELPCCLILWVPPQAASLPASTIAVALTKGVWTYFKPRCQAIWNAWVPCWETAVPSETHIVLITPELCTWWICIFLLSYRTASEKIRVLPCAGLSISSCSKDQKEVIRVEGTEFEDFSKTF